MKYIRKRSGVMEDRPASPYMGTAWYAERGYIAYAGTLPLDRLDIQNGEVVELPAPEATEEWVEKRPFIDAVTALIPDDKKPAVAADWQTVAWVAKLPGDLVNLLDPEVAEFLTAAGLTLDAIRAKMEELNA